MKHDKTAKDIDTTIHAPAEKFKEFALKRKNLLDTGSTLLNLAISNNPFGGFLKGKYYLIVGDSTSGKTFLSLSCFAEAVCNKHFKKHRLIYDNVEDGCLIDIDTLFGEAVADRIEPPACTKDGDPIYSYTVEDFYYNLDDAIQEGKPFVYVVDSMDSLSSRAENEKFSEHKKAHRLGKDSPGSYGDGKAKKNSEGLRKVLNGLREQGSILLVLNQTRDNLGFGHEKKTASGGRALRFYSTVEIWASVAGTIKKTVKGKQRKIGTKIKIQVKKNRITGKLHTIETEIYPSYGIDDIGSCVDYLADEGWWEKSKNTITAKEFNLEGSREKIIRQIEKKSLVDELRGIVGNCWKEIEEASALKRKKKYDLDSN